MSLLELQAAGLRAASGWRLAPLTLDLEPGRPVLLVGPNGAGKSSLIRLLLGLDSMSVGRVRVGGVDLRQLPPGRRAALLSWLPQLSDAVEPMRAIEWVAAARFRFEENAAASEQAAHAVLRISGLEHLAHRYTDELSGGELQRLRIASLQAQAADWWCLDEPTNHLDPAARAAVVRQLTLALTPERGLLVATHDLTLLHALPTARVLGLQQGELAFDLPCDHPTLGDRLRTLYGTPVREHALDGRRWFFFAGDP